MDDQARREHHQGNEDLVGQHLPEALSFRHVARNELMGGERHNDGQPHGVPEGERRHLEGADHEPFPELHEDEAVDGDGDGEEQDRQEEVQKGRHNDLGSA